MPSHQQPDRRRIAALAPGSAASSAARTASSPALPIATPGSAVYGALKSGAAMLTGTRRGVTEFSVTLPRPDVPSTLTPGTAQSWPIEGEGMPDKEHAVSTERSSLKLTSKADWMRFASVMHTDTKTHGT